MTDKKTPVIITLETVCAEIGIDPREGRKRLRYAVKDAKAYPQLAANHVGGGAWEWPEGSPQLVEAKKALDTPLQERIKSCNLLL